MTKTTQEGEPPLPQKTTERNGQRKTGTPQLDSRFGIAFRMAVFFEGVPCNDSQGGLA